MKEFDIPYREEILEKLAEIKLNLAFIEEKLGEWVD